MGVTWLLLGRVARADGRAGFDGEANLGGATVDLRIVNSPDGTEKGGREAALGD